MNNHFKPLSQQIANKLVAQFKEGNSVFQRGNIPLQMPFNPTTNIRYRGVAALILLMSQRDDPRWMSLENANYNKTPVNKGERGTLISFYATSEMQPVIKDGQQVFQENGKPSMERVKLAEAELVNVFLWNGAQLKNMPPLAANPGEFAAMERARQIIENSGLASLPDNQDIPVGQSYFLSSLKDIAKLKVAERPSDNAVKDVLTTLIASLFISAELNLPFEMGEFTGFTEGFSRLITEKPAELFKAANDGQKIADVILGLEQRKEQQIAITDSLNKGDIIAYQGDTITVLAQLKGRAVQVENSEGEKFKVSMKDSLYAELIEAKRVAQQSPNGHTSAYYINTPTEESAEEKSNDLAR